MNVAKLALAVSRRHLADYGSIKSRKDFTQPQLMACLILKTYKKTTYRGIMDELACSAELREVIGLTKVPHWTTVQKFAARDGTKQVAEAMLGTILEAAMSGDESVERDELFLSAAMDSTGLQTGSASAHFVSRSGQKRKKYVKVSVAILCGALLPASLVVDWGPSNDKVEASALMAESQRRLPGVDVLYADAGYDAEWVHEVAREDWGVMTAIPPVQHKKDGTVGGHYRSKMTPGWLKAIGYGDRWHVESFFSGMKRTMGWTLGGRSERALFTEATLKVLTYAIRR